MKEKLLFARDNIENGDNVKREFVEINSHEYVGLEMRNYCIAIFFICIKLFLLFPTPYFLCPLLSILMLSTKN